MKEKGMLIFRERDENITITVCEKGLNKKQLSEVEKGEKENVKE